MFVGIQALDNVQSHVVCFLYRSVATCSEAMTNLKALSNSYDRKQGSRRPDCLQITCSLKSTAEFVDTIPMPFRTYLYLIDLKKVHISAT